MVEGIQLLGSGLNTDDHPLVRPNGDSVFRQDIVYGQDGDFGSLVGIKAATEVPLLPEWSTWANKACIGSCEYIQNNSFIFLLYGETTVGQTTTKNVVIGEVLSDDSINVVGYLPPNMPVNYTKDTRIYPYIIDKFLGFTDGIVEPILINIERAKLYQQNKTFKYVYPFTPEISINDVVYWKGMGLYKYKGANVTAPPDYYVLKAIRDANPNSLLPSKWSDDKDPFTQWEGVWWDENKQHVWRLILDDFNISSLPNVNQLSEITTFTAQRNNISSINIDGLLKLENFQINNNQVSSINLSTNLSLKYLDVSNNQLGSINTSGLNLSLVRCNYNRITSLDLTGSTELDLLECGWNGMSTLSIPSGGSLVRLLVSNNNITAIPTLTSRQSIPIGDADFWYNSLVPDEVTRLYSIGFTFQEIGVLQP